MPVIKIKHETFAALQELTTQPFEPHEVSEDMVQITISPGLFSRIIRVPGSTHDQQIQFLINVWKEETDNAPARPQRPPKW